MTKLNLNNAKPDPNRPHNAFERILGGVETVVTRWVHQCHPALHAVRLTHSNASHVPEGAR